MTVEPAPTARAESRERHSYAHLHGHWRRLACGLWITVVACTLSISLASLPVYLAQWQTPCAGSACSYQQLTPEQVGALINVVVCLAVSAVIALRRPDDRMAFVSSRSCS